MPQTTSVKFKHAEGTCILDFDWSGSSVCGRGPDDEVPDIGDIRGWIENAAGEHVRDLTDAEIETLTVDTGPVADAMYEAVHEAYNEPAEPDWDRP